MKKKKQRNRQTWKKKKSNNDSRQQKFKYINLIVVKMFEKEKILYHNLGVMKTRCVIC